MALTDHGAHPYRHCPVYDRQTQIISNTAVTTTRIHCVPMFPSRIYNVRQSCPIYTRGHGMVAISREMKMNDTRTIRIRHAFAPSWLIPEPRGHRHIHLRTPTDRYSLQTMSCALKHQSMSNATYWHCDTTPTPPTFPIPHVVVRSSTTQRDLTGMDLAVLIAFSGPPCCPGLAFETCSALA